MNMFSSSRLLSVCASFLTPFISSQFTKFGTMAVKAPVLYDYGSFLVELVPALQDNYMYVVIDKSSNEAAVVDPVNPQAVLDVVDQHGSKLKHVWTTHHHYDHAGGNVKLKEMKPEVDVFGGGDEVPGVTKILKDNDRFTLGNNTEVSIIYTPCHTTDSICYHVTSKETPNNIVFTGDTLFIAGAGKFFQGTGADMHKNLNVKLSALPNDCKVFCGHEYTVSNLKFAKFMEPNNSKILEKLEWAEDKRSRMEPTIPSTIEEEKETNPFMRIDQKEYKALATDNRDEPARIMDLVREKKNNWKPS